MLEAFGAWGHFDGEYRHMHMLSPAIVGQGELCYLCGSAPPEHAEHVIPTSRGGTNRISNLGASCAACNLSKGSKLIEPTLDQAERLAAQQARLWAALDAVDQDALWAWSYEGDVALAVDLLGEEFAEEPGWVDRDDILGAVGLDDLQDAIDVFGPKAPSDLRDKIVTEVLRRLRARYASAE